MTQTLVLQTLQDLIDLGVAALVPIAIKFLLSKISKDKLEKNSKLALNVVKAAQVASGVDVDVTKVASDKLSALTKGKLSVDNIEHLVGAAVYEVKKDTAQALADATPVVSAPVATDATDTSAVPNPTATN